MTKRFKVGLLVFKKEAEVEIEIVRHRNRNQVQAQCGHEVIKRRREQV